MLLGDGGAYAEPSREGYQPISQVGDEPGRRRLSGVKRALLQSQAVGPTEEAPPRRASVLEGQGLWHKFARGDFTIVPRPDGHRFLDTWDIIVIICLGLTAVLVPFEVALLDEVPLTLYRVDKAIDAVFMLDIVLTFFVAILPSGSEEQASISGDSIDQYIVAPRKIAQQYMAVPFSSNFTAGWFWPDVLTVFPWDIAPEVAHLSKLRLVRVLRLVRMLRLVRVVKLFKRWQTSWGVSYSLVKVVTCGLSTLLLVHWLACLWGHLGLYPYEGEGKTWLSNHLTDEHHIDDMPIAKVYTVSLYFCTVVLTTVGFGDVLPVNDVEVCIMICTIFLTGITWAWVVATVVNVITNMDLFGTHFNQIMDDMNNLMNGRGISKDLRFRIRRHIQTAYTMRRERHHHAAIEWLSEGLQGKLAIESGMNQVCDCIWYLNRQDVSDKVQIELADEFKADLYSPSEYIMDRDKISVIARGSCLRKGKVTVRWAVIGEDVILVSDHLRDTSCPWTLTFVDVLSIHKDSLREASMKFPEFDRRLRRAQVKLALWRSFVLIADRRKSSNRMTKRSSWQKCFGHDHEHRMTHHRMVTGQGHKSWAASFDAKDNPVEDYTRLMRQMQQSFLQTTDAAYQGMREIQGKLEGTQEAIRGMEDRIDRVEKNVQQLSEAVKEVTNRHHNHHHIHVPSTFPGSPSKSSMTHKLRSMTHGFGAVPS